MALMTMLALIDRDAMNESSLEAIDHEDGALSVCVRSQRPHHTEGTDFIVTVRPRLLFYQCILLNAHFKFLVVNDVIHFIRIFICLKLALLFSVLCRLVNKHVVVKSK